MIKLENEYIIVTYLDRSKKIRLQYCLNPEVEVYYDNILVLTQEGNVNNKISIFL